MKRQLSKGQKLLLLVVALVAGLYLYLNRVYDPVMHAYIGTSKDLISLRTEVAGQEAAGGGGALRTRKRELEQEIKALEGRLSERAALRKAQTEQEVTEALISINSLALSSGMELIRQEARAAPEEAAAVVSEGAAQFHWWEYQVVYKGDTHQLLLFLEGKRAAEYLVLIKNVRMEYVKDGGEDDDKAGASGIAEITMSLFI